MLLWTNLDPAEDTFLPTARARLILLIDSRKFCRIGNYSGDTVSYYICRSPNTRSPRNMKYSQLPINIVVLFTSIVCHDRDSCVLTKGEVFDSILGKSFV